MQLFLSIWLTLAGVVGAIWLVRFIVIGVIKNRRPVLSSGSYDGNVSPAPRVSVLVAAKDEEDNIETCVRTFLDQDYPNYEMIVIDDRSRDRTPHILAKLKSEFPARLKVITVTRLRDGWFGKNNAMREGVAVASGDWLLFCDADCRQTSRRTISAAIHEANAHKADFLSIIPVLDTYEIWERIIQPVCALILILWFLPSRVNDPRKKTAYANGQFMLLSRRCYDEIGGHERVRTQLNEDILMARHTKAGGLRLRVVENADLYRTRMYRTPREAWRGWSRIYAGSFGSVARVLTAMAVLLTFSLLPTTSLIIALIGSWLGEGASVAACRTAVWCWAGVILFQQMTLWRLYGILQMPRGWSFTYVIGAFAAMGILGNALLKTMGMSSTTWRGTTYHGERVTGGGAPSANSEAIPPPLSKPSPAD